MSLRFSADGPARSGSRGSTPATAADRLRPSAAPRPSAAAEAADPASVRPGARADHGEGAGGGRRRRSERDMIAETRANGAPNRDIGLDLIDTHCHLDAEAFDGEPVAAILSCARKAGITRVVTIGTDVASSIGAARLAALNDGVWCAVGVDPNDLDGFGPAALDELRALAVSPKVVAIGEIGLDYHWLRSPRDVQVRAFVQQLELAAELDLPVVIHCREADDDTEAVLREWSGSQGERPGGRPRGVMHCYGGDAERAERLLGLGFVISLAGTVTFKNNPVAHEVARMLPDEGFVLETDSPFLAPHPYRGRRNEPAHIATIAAGVAELRGSSIDRIAGLTSANARRLFGWQ